MEDNYNTLGIKDTSSLTYIKKTFRELIKKYHPDGSDPDRQLFEKIFKAYELITDPEKHYVPDKTSNVINLNILQPIEKFMFGGTVKAVVSVNKYMATEEGEARIYLAEIEDTFVPRTLPHKKTYNVVLGGIDFEVTVDYTLNSQVYFVENGLFGKELTLNCEDIIESKVVDVNFLGDVFGLKLNPYIHSGSILPINSKFGKVLVRVKDITGYPDTNEEPLEDIDITWKQEIAEIRGKYGKKAEHL